MAKTKKKGWINIFKTRKGEPYTHDAVFCDERAKQVRKEERQKVLRLLGVAAALLATFSVVVYLIWRVF